MHSWSSRLPPCKGGRHKPKVQCMRLHAYRLGSTWPEVNRAGTQEGSYHYRPPATYAVALLQAALSSALCRLQVTTGQSYRCPLSNFSYSAALDTATRTMLNWLAGPPACRPQHRSEAPAQLQRPPQVTPPGLPRCQCPSLRLRLAHRLRKPPARLGLPIPPSLHLRSVQLRCPAAAALAP